MKKMTPRDRVLLMILIVVGVIALLYKFAYVPLQDKKFELKEQIASLEMQKKDIPSLESQLSTIKSQSTELEKEIDKMDAQKGFGVMNYQELLTYLGESAKEYEVDITSFRRLSYENKVNYWEVPFELSVQGDYRDIILFVDSIYQLNEYFAIRKVNLQQIDMIPMTDLVTAGQNSSGVGFVWGPYFIEKLNENIPSNLLDPTKESDNGLDIGDMTQSQYIDYLNAFNGEYEVDREIQLQFSFHFISLEETPEDLKE